MPSAMKARATVIQNRASGLSLIQSDPTQTGGA
jgi:hypothetical protein